MAWISASFLTDAGHAEPLCDALLESGALSASIEDADAGTPAETPQFGEPDMETPATAWAHSRIVALFEENAPVGEIMAKAAALLGLPQSPD
ncbi:MAG: 50S ribosomal protein L11 methyltransferase, partial [Zoogloeaceae bacterium]|nr:50S ribosomal protein L11 methyltransferase [Zoogloeaceae bacterium]